MSLQRQLPFRVNLLFQLLLTGVSTAAGLIACIPVFLHSSTVAGWTLSGAIFLLGTFQLVSGFVSVFIEPNLSFFQEKVINGELDDYLTRPVPTLFMASFNSSNPWGLFQVLLGIAIVIAGINMQHTGIAIVSVALYVVQVLVGCVIAWGYRAMIASLSFWLPGAEPSVLFDAFWQFGRYPVNMYSRSVQRFLTYVIPVAFISTIPAETLAYGIHALAVLFSFLVGGTSTVAAGLIWRAGLRKYTSATS